MAEDAASGASDAAWTTVLDQMEGDVARLRRCALDSEELFELPSSWSPPENVGPLPAALGLRARALFAEMQELSAVLKERRDETARQLRAIDSVPRSGTQGAVYIDLLG
ncbi:hypothetical protein ACSYDW_03495 [Paeniglutamicibacter sp. R2-26]|uniref:hypothetical protein n=1 Tax=Paeniglutamicibacter sp. R2-26 TaxID=3144417 RepID=UPI003EE553E5